MKKLSLIVLSISLFAACMQTDRFENPDANRTPADFTLNWEKAWGTTYYEDFSGAVIDNSGNMYFVGTSQPDGYAADVFLTKVNLENQNVVWAKNFATENQDFQPSPSENGRSQGGGGSRCVATDATGNVYIAGTSKQGFNQVFVAKINNSGTLLWQKFWAADNSGLAKSAAKAFALDIANDKIFVTGSTGAGNGQEESQLFLLILNTETGEIDPATYLGIDLSEGYNDRGYSVKADANGIVYIAGWEGKNNSGFLMKFSGNGSVLEWTERINIGFAGRLTDIDLDAAGNVYLAADIRGVSSYLGVVKTDSDGNILWAKQMQGEANDRNNISSIRIINNNLYIGGKGAYTGYDVSQFGDACFYKMDLNGTIQKQYNYFTSSEAGDRCGERIEAILSYNGKLILAGETVPEASKIKGNWYIPTSNVSDLSASASKITPTTTTGAGIFVSTSFTESILSTPTYEPSEGSKGLADVIIFSIPE